MMLREFLERLRGVRRAGEGWLAFCPAHDDGQEPALSVKQARDRLLVHCHAGCPVGDIVSALRLQIADLFLDAGNGASPPTAPATRAEPVATYEYQDEAGAPLYRVVRFQPKTFRQQRYAGGEWLWGLGDVTRVVYHWPTLRGAESVLLVEGEKDVEALAAAGFLATTTPGGASNWRPVYAQQLKAVGVQSVIILPDNDEPGRAYADAARVALLAEGVTARLCALPGLAERGDVSDWLETHTPDELRAVLAQRLSVLRPLPELFASPPPKPIWLVQNLLRERANGWLAAGAKAGKSFLALDLLLAAALGVPWLGQFEVPRPLTVVLVEEEDDAWRVYTRAQRLLRGRNLDTPPATFYYTIRSGLRLDDPTALGRLLDDLRELSPDLVLWDVFNRLHVQDERRPEQMRPILHSLDVTRDEIGCANLMLHHSRKPSASGPDMASGGQKLRGPSEFWGWAENSLYLTPLKTKGHVVVEPESKDAQLEPFRVHLDDGGWVDGPVTWVYDGVAEARISKGEGTRRQILAAVAASPLSLEAISTAVGLTTRSVGRHLAALEQDGALRWQPDPDRPKKRLWLLPEQ